MGVIEVGVMLFSQNTGSFVIGFWGGVVCMYRLCVGAMPTVQRSAHSCL